MANKRDLKKQVRYICGDIATECLFIGEYVDGIDRSAVFPVVEKIANLQEQTLRHISFSFDKAAADFGNTKEYRKARNVYYRAAFASLRENFNAHLTEIAKEMNATVPVKRKEEANKK